jgi:predicted PurR-regulated permease PerM
LAAQALLGSLFGVLGLALATPLVAAALAAIRILYVENVLDDDMRSAL